MKVKFYPPDDGLSAQQIKRGDVWLYADVECPWCEKVQPVAATGYVGGPCVSCGGEVALNARIATARACAAAIRALANAPDAGARKEGEG